MNYILSIYIMYCIFNTTRQLLKKISFRFLIGGKKYGGK